ncbi:MAG: hypothetical protein UFS17_08750, partial [[Ruminococcus] lactaris]|nr:hypothetical protein [[Ruminococcus] lactaris]
MNFFVCPAAQNFGTFHDMSGNKKYLLRIISQNRYFIIFYKMLSGAKAPDFDAYGLLRATHSHNPTQSSHIVGLSSHFYAHIGAGQKVFHPPMSKLM